ncbi:MAG: NAD-dependent epimerase/dehydratase family protein [Psychrosphaera sp.]|nr:NAD-dependent epimerase/dehydratase family protein [Psychrosphaera sp.]
MALNDKNKPVMVTGGSGYVASWLIKMLLEAGFLVHITVRDKQNQGKIQHLLDIAAEASGTLEVFSADLLNPGSFDDAMKGCAVVFHTASPFVLSGIKDPQKELVEPALQGTVNLLSAANNCETVQRVVLTSSIAAVMGDYVEINQAPEGCFNETCWNETSSLEHQPYYYSKAIAETKAWEMVKLQNRWDLVVLNPGFVMGPSLTKRNDSASISTMISMADGTYKSGLPCLYNGMVDVRDVAQAHFSAGFKEDASGRHILVSDSVTLFAIAKMLKAHFDGASGGASGGHAFPAFEVPKWLVWVIAPLLGRTRKYVSLNFNIKIKYDNSRSRSELGLEYRSIETTVVEHLQQIIDDGLV